MSRFSALVRGSCPYTVLGVPRGVSAEGLRDAYRACALRDHPDKNPPSDRAAAELRFKEAAAAYEMLAGAVECACLRRSMFYDVFGVRPHQREDTMSHVLRAAGMRMLSSGKVMLLADGASSGAHRDSRWGHVSHR
eukprot:2988925-Prymnesium_polylepis.1